MTTRKRPAAPRKRRTAEQARTATLDAEQRLVGAAPRKRRTAEQARTATLDAEQRLVEAVPRKRRTAEQARTATLDAEQRLVEAVPRKRRTAEQARTATLDAEQRLVEAVPRKRRTAEQARTAILDAAERRLVEAGPSGIRLQEVAADVGVSHPTVLHHFGSREALVEAVLERVQQSIYTPILEALRTTSLEEDAMARLLDRVFEAVGRRGLARVLFWLTLQGAELPDEREPLRAVVDVAHEVRRQKRAHGGRATRPPSLEDTRFAVVLATLAMTAKSVLGRHLFESVGLGADDAVQQRFRAWLAKLLVKHLESS